MNINKPSFQERQFSCRSSSQGKLCCLQSYFPSVLYIDFIYICKKQKWMPEGDHEILAAGHFRLVIRVVKKKQFWDKQLLFHFLNLYVKKTLAKAVACIMIFNTALTMTNLSSNSQNRLFSCSGIGLLIGRNKKIKNCVYVAAHASSFFFSHTKTFYETVDL